MTREEKCKLAIEQGFTYDSETGIVYSKYNRIINSICNGVRNKGYINIQIYSNKNRYTLRAHQFAWYYIFKECVETIDHINGIKNDNRICNLRAITHQQNQWNQINSKGYRWNKISKKWSSKIRVNKKDIYLGSYNTEQEARSAYLAAKEIYHKI